MDPAVTWEFLSRLSPAATDGGSGGGGVPLFAPREEATKAPPLGGGASSSRGNDDDDASAGTGDYTWQSCRFCRQKYFVTSERLLDHEISCPSMHRLQASQLLKQHHQQLTQQLTQQLIRQGGQFGQLLAQMQQLGAQQASHQIQVQMQQLAAMQASPQSQGESMLQLLAAIQGQLQDTLESQYGYTFPRHDAPGQMQGRRQVSQGAHHSNNPMGQHFQSQASHRSESNHAIDHEPAAASTTAPVHVLHQGAAPHHSATDHFPLSLPEDEKWLTPLHCFTRRHCVEAFVATMDDVAAPCMGKRDPVTDTQVGLRCPHCAPTRTSMGAATDKHGEKAVVFPSTIRRIYNSSVTLIQRHLRTCQFVPPDILARYEELKASPARCGGSKRYWADSAKRLGLVDTDDGIRLDEEVHRAYREGNQTSNKASSEATSLQAGQDDGVEAPPLVLPSDKRITTSFTFHLMRQLRPCTLAEADRLGHRRTQTVGFPGLACRHCFPSHGSGRFFPASIKTMTDNSKTLDVIYKHVDRCTDCPEDIQTGLRTLRDYHDGERDKLPYKSQRAFFVEIWKRLHHEYPSPRAAAGGADAKKARQKQTQQVMSPAEKLEHYTKLNFRRLHRRAAKYNDGVPAPPTAEDGPSRANVSADAKNARRRQAYQAMSPEEKRARRRRRSEARSQAIQRQKWVEKQVLK